MMTDTREPGMRSGPIRYVPGVGERQCNQQRVIWVRYDMDDPTMIEVEFVAADCKTYVYKMKLDTWRTRVRPNVVIHERYKRKNKNDLKGDWRVGKNAKDDKEKDKPDTLEASRKRDR